MMLDSMEQEEVRRKMHRQKLEEEPLVIELQCEIRRLKAMIEELEAENWELHEYM